MDNKLAQKLQAFVDLTANDRALIADLSADVQRYRARDVLIREGDRPEVVFLLLEGWAYRYKILSDGSRQIVAYLLPGDLCDLHIFILREMDHAIGLLSDAKVAAIPKDKILDLTTRSPNVARALWWATLVDEAVLREWLVNMGQRDAYDRLAHLFAELWLRLDRVGLVRDRAFDLPLTQEELGDTIGLTAVHVNRKLQEMRQSGLIELSRTRIRIPDIERLMQASDFDPNYLHLRRRNG